jgi:hypothetical protein
MSAFICVSTHNQRLEIGAYFSSPLHVIDLTNTPTGQLLLGGRQEGHVSTIIHGLCSTDITRRNRRTPDATRLFCEGLKCLPLAYPYASVLVHWFRGDIRKEKFLISSIQKIQIDAFLEKFPDEILEDVKYVFIPAIKDP